MAKAVPLGAALSIHGYFVVDNGLGAGPSGDLMLKTLASEGGRGRFMHSPVETADLSKLYLALGSFEYPSFSEQIQSTKFINSCRP